MGTLPGPEPALGAHRRPPSGPATPFPNWFATTIEDCGEVALAEGIIVVHDPTGILVVPDVIMLQAEAAGETCPPTWRIERDDGRTVYLYRPAVQ